MGAVGPKTNKLHLENKLIATCGVFSFHIFRPIVTSPLLLDRAANVG